MYPKNLYPFILLFQAGHPDWWFFKVKRYPWNVSYGNKHADKAIEATKTLLEKQNVSLPPPSNMDAESAKSLLIFLLKVSNFLEQLIKGENAR